MQIDDNICNNFHKEKFKPITTCEHILQIQFKQYECSHECIRIHLIHFCTCICYLFWCFSTRITKQGKLTCELRINPSQVYYMHMINCKDENALKNQELFFKLPQSFEQIYLNKVKVVMEENLSRIRIFETMNNKCCEAISSGP